MANLAISDLKSLASKYSSRYFDALLHPVSNKMAQIEAMKQAFQDKEIPNIFADGASGMLKVAKAQCPVDSWRLRESLRIEVTDVNSMHHTGHVGTFAVKNALCWIATDVYYASWVEYGTKHSAPHPFMRPAMDQGAQGMANHVGDKIAVKVMQRYLGQGVINT